MMFQNAAGNEARIMPPRVYERPTPEIYAPKKKIADANNLPEFIQYDNADDDTANCEQEDDEYLADPILSQQSTDAVEQTQNFFINPVPRPVEPVGLHLQYEETISADSLLFSTTSNSVGHTGLLSILTIKLKMPCTLTRLYLRSLRLPVSHTSA